MEKCCGNCKWCRLVFDGKGMCVFPLPQWLMENFAIPYVSTERYGTDCPCFTPREEAGS